MFATLRYLFAAFTVLVAAIFVISPFAGTFVEQWSRHDVELRSTLVFNSMRDEFANLLTVGAATPINNLFDRLAPDDWLLAAGFCDRDGSLRYHSKLIWVRNVVDLVWESARLRRLKSQLLHAAAHQGLGRVLTPLID